MVAIITDNFKRKFIDEIISDVGTSSGYYVAIGRSEDWDSSDTVPNPTNSLAEQRRFRESMQSIKLGEDVSYVIPRNNWSSGTTYDAYDDAVGGYPSNAYYVITDELQVYICLQQGKTTAGVAVPSSIKPQGTGLDPSTKSDGYVWRYLYTISALRSSQFVTANFLPVEKIDSLGTGASVIDTKNKAIQDSATPGEIVGIRLTNGGTGYTTAPTIGINGRFRNNDSVGHSLNKLAAATATVSGGAIVKIEMNDSGSGKAFGRNYDFAQITVTGGGPIPHHGLWTLPVLG